jgi:hypothetical protein
LLVGVQWKEEVAEAAHQKGILFDTIQPSLSLALTVARASENGGGKKGVY